MKTLLERCRQAIADHSYAIQFQWHRVLLADLDAAIAQEAEEPVAWVPRAIIDTDTMVVGEFSWTEVSEAPFDMGDTTKWECCPLYAAPQPSATSGMPEMPEPDARNAQARPGANTVVAVHQPEASHMTPTPKLIADTPLMTHDTPAQRLELAAIAAHRDKYPAAPPWQELAHETRMMWLQYLETR